MQNGSWIRSHIRQIVGSWYEIAAQNYSRRKPLQFNELKSHSKVVRNDNAFCHWSEPILDIWNRHNQVVMRCGRNQQMDQCECMVCRLRLIARWHKHTFLSYFIHENVHTECRVQRTRTCSLSTHEMDRDLNESAELLIANGRAIWRVSMQFNDQPNRHNSNFTFIISLHWRTQIYHF